MNTRPQRLIAFILIISPWIYVASAFKEVVFILLGIGLFISTLDIRKKKISIVGEIPTTAQHSTSRVDTV